LKFFVTKDAEESVSMMDYMYDQDKYPPLDSYFLLIRPDEGIKIFYLILMIIKLLNLGKLL
jgi:hypothetical protein